MDTMTSAVVTSISVEVHGRFEQDQNFLKYKRLNVDQKNPSWHAIRMNRHRILDNHNKADFRQEEMTHE